MKKLIFIAIIAAFAVPAMANLTLTYSDLMNFEVLDYQNGSKAFTNDADYLSVVTTNPSDDSKPGSVGFKINNDADTEASFLRNNDYVVIGGSFDLGTTSDTFAMRVNNINDDLWSYELFIDDVSQGSAVELNNYTTEPYSTLLTSTNTLKGSHEIGLKISFTGTEGDNTTSDSMYTSVTVPAPGAFLLGGLGLSLVGYIKRRRMLN